jgi:hypothetical protein
LNDESRNAALPGFFRTRVAVNPAKAGFESVPGSQQSRP